MNKSEINIENIYIEKIILYTDSDLLKEENCEIKQKKSLKNENIDIEKKIHHNINEEKSTNADDNEIPFIAPRRIKTKRNFGNDNKEDLNG